MLLRWTARLIAAFSVPFRDRTGNRCRLRQPPQSTRTWLNGLIQCKKLQEIQARSIEILCKQRQLAQEREALRLVPFCSCSSFCAATSTKCSPQVNTALHSYRGVPAADLQNTRQPAEVTVDHHIRLLRDYNKTKDVGQQLIGLIAESRGVPIGSLYQSGSYGVGPDD